MAAYAARPSGSAFDSASRIAPTASSALRGSCHQWGSAAFPGPILFTESISVTTRASAPALSIASSSHSSRSPPERRTSLDFASDLTSSGRGSYSCGSAFGASSPVTSTRSAADVAGEVGDLRRGRGDGDAAAPARGIPSAAGDQQHERSGGDGKSAEHTSSLLKMILMCTEFTAASHPAPAHTGTTPCRFHGRSTRLPSAISSARMIVGRVSRGSMTSSTMSLAAAT